MYTLEGIAFPGDSASGSQAADRVHRRLAHRKSKGEVYETFQFLLDRKDHNKKEMAQLARVAPYAEPVWTTRGYSPYYNDSHIRLRRELREYVDREIIPHAAEWEESGSVPAEVGAFNFRSQQRDPFSVFADHFSSKYKSSAQMD